MGGNGQVIQGRERGAVAVTMALTLLVLIGMVALALDGGLVYNERRSTHNAADHAALAAAWAECNGANTAAATQAGIDSAALNGFPSGVSVSKDAVSGNWIAEVTSVGDTQFANVIGTDQVTVRSEAEATCTALGGLGGFAIYGGAPPSCSGHEVNIPTAWKTINGAVHSQGDFQSTGAPMFADYNGPSTWVGDRNTNHPGAFDPPGQQSSPYDPTYWMVPSHWLDVDQWKDRSPSSTYFKYTGDQMVSDAFLAQPGTYFVDGNVQALGLNLTNRTIVATGDIHLSGAANSLTAFEPDGLVLLSFEDAGSYAEGSTESCSAIAIHGSAAGNSWSGVMFAPNGEIRLNNAGSFSIDGSLIGYRINLASGDTTVTYNDAFGGETQFRVELTK